MKSKIIGAIFILLGVCGILFITVKYIGLARTLTVVSMILVILFIVIGVFLVDDSEINEKAESATEDIESAINDIHHIENPTYRDICWNDTLLSCVDRFYQPDELEPDMQVTIQLYYFGDDLDKIFNYSKINIGKIQRII